MQVVRAQGTAYERGAVIGAAFADSVARSVAFNRRYLAAHGLARADLEGILTPYLSASNEALPDLVDQIRGMADGAGAPFWDLFFANAFEEVDGVLEPGHRPRCCRSGAQPSRYAPRSHSAGPQRAVVCRRRRRRRNRVRHPGRRPCSARAGGRRNAAAGRAERARGGVRHDVVVRHDERVGIPRALVARSLLESATATTRTRERVATVGQGDTPTCVPSPEATPASSSRPHPPRRCWTSTCTRTMHSMPTSRRRPASRRRAVGPGCRGLAPWPPRRLATRDG